MADTNESIGSGVGNPNEGLLQLAHREMVGVYIEAIETSGKVAVAAETDPKDFPGHFAFHPIDN